MASTLKIKGTSLTSFNIGLFNPFILDASALTAARTWTIPDSNGVSGQVLTTDGAGNLSWTTVGSSFNPQLTMMYSMIGLG
jgi:hypothetical protein